jgi:hypothetical protein
MPANLYRLTFLGTMDGPATCKPEPKPDVIPFPKKPKRKSKMETLAMQFKKDSALSKGEPRDLSKGEPRDLSKGEPRDLSKGELSIILLGYPPRL